MDPCIVKPHAFCILAAGTGSRMGHLTSIVNKALLPVDHQAVISRIIEKVPEDCDIVVAVHYDKDKLREYCEAAHPDKSFVFVEVDKIQGPGSGPGYSLQCCKPHLQRPFYICNVDTLITDEEYPDLSVDWIGTAYTEFPKQYATVECDPLGNVIRLIDKSPRGTSTAYIGLAGIRNFSVFWANLKPGKTDEFQYIKAFSKSYLRYVTLYAKELEWLDTGCVEGYQDACHAFATGEYLGMEKTIDEVTYKVGDRLIKLCADSEKNRKRLARGKILGSTPEVVYSGSYVAAWKWIQGKSLYEVTELEDWECFLDDCNAEFWEHEYEVPNWREICFKFYHDKTFERLKLYRERQSLDAAYLFVNGYQCGHVEGYLDQIDWDWVCEGYPVKFHGDLQFDNAIWEVRGHYRYIDWRECFGDSELYGDVYYDLAKLYSGIDLPYNKLKTKEFSLKTEKGLNNWGFAHYNVNISSNLASFRMIYEAWLRNEGFNVDRVRLLSALIHLNMSPLHPAPVGDLLFYHANLRLAILSTTGNAGFSRGR